MSTEVQMLEINQMKPRTLRKINDFVQQTLRPNSGPQIIVHRFKRTLYRVVVSYRRKSNKPAEVWIRNPSDPDMSYRTTRWGDGWGTSVYTKWTEGEPNMRGTVEVVPVRYADLSTELVLDWVAYMLGARRAAVKQSVGEGLADDDEWLERLDNSVGHANAYLDFELTAHQNTDVWELVPRHIRDRHIDFTKVFGC